MNDTISFDIISGCVSRIVSYLNLLFLLSYILYSLHSTLLNYTDRSL